MKVLLICCILSYLPLRWVVKVPPRVIVIGGGAAGYFSAIRLAERLSFSQVPSEVLVLEAGKFPLSKVLISGGGRCNVMHDYDKGVDRIVRGYPRGRKELLGLYNKVFGPKETFDWFSTRGLPLKTESDGRMFPITDKSTSVIETLERAAKAVNVKVHCDMKVQWVGVNRENSGFSLELSQTPTSLSSDNIVHCQRLIIATGSARGGHRLAQGLGHAVASPLPSLFSFVVKDKSLTSLAGLSSKFARISLCLPANLSSSRQLRVFTNGTSTTTEELRASLTQRGPLLITQHGITGPVVLKLSAFAAKILAALQFRCPISINWAGELTDKELMEIFLAEKAMFGGRNIGKGFPAIHSSNLPQITGGYDYGLESRGESPDRSAEEEEELDLDDAGSLRLMSRRLWWYFLERCRVDRASKWSSVKTSTLQLLAKEITQCRLSVEGRGSYREEFVTCGGVSLSDVDMQTMESRKTPGLYFCGEVLDIDGITGGYNFQSAWTTGYIAGSSCAQSVIDEVKGRGREKPNTPIIK